jgi:hypothetical protein
MCGHLNRENGQDPRWPVPAMAVLHQLSLSRVG